MKDILIIVAVFATCNVLGELLTGWVRLKMNPPRPPSRIVRVERYGSGFRATMECGHVFTIASADCQQCGPITGHTLGTANATDAAEPGTPEVK